MSLFSKQNVFPSMHMCCEWQSIVASFFLTLGKFISHNPIGHSRIIKLSHLALQVEIIKLDCSRNT